LQYRRALSRVVRDDALYMDIAMTPVEQAEFEKLELYSATRGAKSLVEKRRRRTAARADALPAEEI
jgi:hypothetical protein